MRGRQPLLLPLNVFKHLFEHAIREDLSVNKKDLVRDYFKAAGNYPYDAANVEEYLALRGLPDS
jgi:hypothetical protein